MRLLADWPLPMGRSTPTFVFVLNGTLLYIQTRRYAMAPEAPLIGDNVTKDRERKRGIEKGNRKKIKRQIGHNRDVGLYFDLIHHKKEHGRKTCDF